MVIRVQSHVNRCYSAADGAVIEALLRAPFARGEQVTLSFQGITDVTSSFVNSALVCFLRSYPMDWLKAHLRIHDVTPQIGDMVLRCLANGERNLGAS